MALLRQAVRGHEPGGLAILWCGTDAEQLAECLLDRRTAALHTSILHNGAL